MAYLEYTDLKTQKHHYPLNDSPIIIGRDKKCQLTLPDKRISRKHLRLQRKNQKWQIDDLGSTNGFALNGVQTNTGELTNNDVIAVGPFMLHFKENLLEQEPSAVLGSDELTRVMQHVADYSKEATDKNYKQILELLWELTEVLDSMNSIKELLNHFGDVISALFSPYCIKVRIEEEQIYRTEPNSSIVDPCIDTVDTIINRITKNKEGVVFENLSAIAASPIHSVQGHRSICSVIATPIWINNAVSGVLYVDRRNPDTLGFKKEDLRTLVVLSRLISSAISGANTLARLSAENRLMSNKIGKAGRIIGVSKKTKKLVSLVETKIGPVDSTVLLTGETGCGKTWIAEAIHLSSKRNTGPFVQINCAAIPRELIESELFGYEKGAFSGAAAPKTGVFEAASKGTLFLDEIGELDFGAQAKLLSVLQDKKLQRVGSTKRKSIDIRIIAATNKSLKNEVEEGRFRADLYYRLNVVNLEIPPLRQRPEDIPSLAQHFLMRACRETGKVIAHIHPEAMDALINYTFPGNIRELSNVIERAVIFSDSPDTLHLQDFPEEIQTLQKSNLHKVEPISQEDEAEKAMIVDALEQANGNKREAARILGWYPQKLYARLKRFSINTP